MAQEDPTKIPIYQPRYGTFSPVYHQNPIQQPTSFPQLGMPSMPQPPPFNNQYPQSQQPYHVIPVGYQAYGAVVEGIPVRERRLPCCGIGVGWMLFLAGFFFAAVPWYVGAFILLFVGADYREKPGLLACTIGAILVAITIIFGVSKEDLDW